MGRCLDGEGTLLQKLLFVDLSKAKEFYRDGPRNRGLRATQSRDSCEGLVRMGFWFFLEPKKIWNDPDPKRIRIEDVGHHLFVAGFSLQNAGGHPTLNIIF